MKISLNWLKDYIETGLEPQKIAQVLSDLGFPTEGTESLDNDTVIDVEITSNRGDCLGYIGIARELAAVAGAEIKMPVVELDEAEGDVAEFASVEIKDPDLCGRYTARIIQGLKVGPAPDWLKNRLQAIGMRSVNNVVDATNYAMVETGQPPHAFDYNKIDQGKIVVRKAIPGERLVSIDGTQCDLDTDMLVLADPKGPVAIAGVMGGLLSEVSNATTDVLLEDAHFDPVTVRTASRKLALPSEAAFRFERTVDIEMVDWASKRAAQLITQAAGGKVAKGVVDVYPQKPEQIQLTLRLVRLRKLLGIDVPSDKAVKILTGLGFNPVAKDDSVTCTVPSWRRADVSREADLIEEVARVHGYNQIPTERKIQIEVVPVDGRKRLTESMAAYLNGCGFYETINVTFVDDSLAELFAPGGKSVQLSGTDASGKHANLLRQTLISSLLVVLKTNLNAGNTPCRIFELADTFVPSHKAKTLPLEKTKLSLVCDSDFRDLQGVVAGLIKSLNSEAEVVFEPAEVPWAQTAANIVVGDKVIGIAGVVSEAVKQKFDFKDITPSAAELDYEQLAELQGGTIKVKPIPRFPAIVRDLSIVVDENVKWKQIQQAVTKKAPQQMEELRFVGIYRGKGIPQGSKSVTLSLKFRDEDGTLTHETVDAFEKAIVASVTKKLDAQIRTI
ncbi:MAG: phenylalanine--tRNA ligase subunit beta [Planctomycetota bacterium]|jgi:phenylalanyl-tRNA synthetase beta chain